MQIFQTTKEYIGERPKSGIFLNRWKRYIISCFPTSIVSLMVCIGLYLLRLEFLLLGTQRYTRHHAEEVEDFSNAIVLKTAYQFRKKLLSESSSQMNSIQ